MRIQNVLIVKRLLEFFRKLILKNHFLITLFSFINDEISMIYERYDKYTNSSQRKTTKKALS